MGYSTGDSGIRSLAGFAYQIKVFIYYMSVLKKNEYIEFETLEDVNIRNVQSEEIDRKSTSYKCVMRNIEKNVAIQVKRTSISTESAKKILYNWLIIEKSHDNINKYILFTDEEYENKDIIFDIDVKELFDKVNNSNSKSNALITIVKNIFNGDFEEFKSTYEIIKGKYKFKSIEGIDDEILNRYEMIFQRGGIPEVIYYMRIQELMRYITGEIMQSVSKGEPFICTYSKFINQVVEICRNIDENQPLISYSLFKSNSIINWEDLDVVNSRECIQLNSCNLSKRNVETHLMYKLYYEFLKCSYMENNKVQRIEDIEDTTYDNYDFSKTILEQENKDTPLNRLSDTKSRSNSYASNEQIKYGAAVYLTRADIEEEKQISWKDDV
ncbi:hypothetical protein C7M56_03245 [Clostridium botulinum]|uniref:DUF4297 domain-containing protein n=1 Tax=Clostridium botulinum TaxID=1491 RepID=A0ABC8CT96_CLOBO|nr:hypothetical protein [Clostridium botulinum]AVQ37749.1 hypothetical protein C7M56_03245 [Clostridium botulinum]